MDQQLLTGKQKLL